MENGWSVPGESIMSDDTEDQEISLHARCTLKPYRILINNEPVTMRCYSINHALKLASNLFLTDEDAVKVEFDEQ